MVGSKAALQSWALSPADEHSRAGDPSVPGHFTDPHNSTTATRQSCCLPMKSDGEAGVMEQQE